MGCNFWHGSITDNFNDKSNNVRKWNSEACRIYGRSALSTPCLGNVFAGHCRNRSTSCSYIKTKKHTTHAKYTGVTHVFSNVLGLFVDWTCVMTSSHDIMQTVPDNSVNTIVPPGKSGKNCLGNHLLWAPAFGCYSNIGRFHVFVEVAQASSFERLWWT